MTNSSFLKKLLFAFSVVLFVSCDKDFNEIGSDIVGDDLHSTTTPYYVDVTAYDRPTGAVQSNNLTLNQLGVFDNPTFGKTISHFVTQLEIPSGSEKPTLFSPVIDSVYIYVPYNSTAKSTETDSDDTGTRTIYTLNDVYGKADAKFRLKIYRNGFYLRDADPAASDKVQRYYSDDYAMVENLKVGTPLAESGEFSFSPAEIKRKVNPAGTNTTTGEMNPGSASKVSERKAPGIFMDLDKAAMQEALFSTTNRGNLLNNNIFKNYFRGLYFQVEQTGDAVATVPKFSEGVVVIKYHDKTVGIDGLPTEIYADKTLTLNLKGNTINFFENTFNTTFNSAITSSDAVNGDSSLYVKGGAGSMAIIDINQAGLDAIDATITGQKVLINEANLVFYVDESKLGTASAPLRVYLYNLKTRLPLYDYSADGTTVTGNTKYNKYIHGGILDTIKDPVTGVLRPRYKIRLTNHINSIVNSDSTNVKLGLVVTEDINNVTNSKIKTSYDEGGTTINSVPLYTVQHPFGTVLYGSNLPVEDKNRVKLEIFYTKPN